MRTHVLSLVWTFLLLTLLGACSNNATALRAGGTHPDGTQQGAPAPAATLPGPISGVQGWPGFPGGSATGGASPVRRASGAVSINGDGRVDEAGLNNYADTLVPNAYVIAPGGDDDLLAFAWYTVTSLDTERPVSLDLHVTAAPVAPGGDDDLPLSYWVGVSDYTRFTWQWSGPYTTPGLRNITLNDQPAGVLDRYISSNLAASPNTIHLVVATAALPQFITALNPKGLSAARIETLTLHTLGASDPGYHATKPHYTPIETIGAPGGGKGGSALDPLTQYVQLTWTHIHDPQNPSNDALFYQLFRQGPMDALPSPIGSVNAPTAMYVDPTDNSFTVPDPVPGATYDYWLNAVNLQGSTPKNQYTYIIPLLGPANVQATDGVYANMVVLTWTQAEGATGYEIYRDGQTSTELLATVGNVNTYDDAGLLDNNWHTYWMRSTNQYMPNGGSWSAPEAGFQFQPNMDTLYALPMQQYAVAVGQPVTIRVVTGQTNNSLVYMNAVGLTVENGASYVPASFNIGEVGGARLDTDGYWALMSPPPASNQYLDLGDALMPGLPTDLGNGFQRYQFDITPANSPLAAPASFPSGAVLFNLQLVFSAVGVYHLGFQQNDGALDRTYYSDATPITYFWGALDSSYTIVVN
jgi:hypothetical protein